MTNLTGALVAAAILLTACSTADGTEASTATAQPDPGPIQIVAAENFWGSIVAQLGGDKVQVTSIIDSPDADPHDYEATAGDGRAIATAQLTIANGVGYDAWAGDLVAANPAPDRTDLVVGDIVGVTEGDNPHRWYNPDDVNAVVDTVTEELKSLDAASADYFDQRKAAFQETAMKPYDGVIASIRSQYGDTPVGASESIVAMIAPALGLDLVTPPDFLTAISEGTDPTAADLMTINEQIRTRAIEVYVYNSQNATPDVQQQVDAAKSAGIPVTTITETMVGSSWEEWQTAQLDALDAALGQAG